MSGFTPLSQHDLVTHGYDTVIVCAPDMAGRLIGKRLTPRKFDEFREYCELLYAQALLAEGSPLPDAARFAKLLSKLMIGASASAGAV